jgi:hypothetical protein
MFFRSSHRQTSMHHDLQKVCRVWVDCCGVPVSPAPDSDAQLGDIELAAVGKAMAFV